MTTPQITNPGQAYALGATWGTPPVQTMPSETVQLINDTATTLFESDIVALHYSGTALVLPATGSLTNVLGVVGSGNAYYPPTTSTGTSTITTNTFPTEVAPSAAAGIWQNTGSGRSANQVAPSFTFGGILTTTATTITSVTSLPAGVTIAAMAGGYVTTPYDGTNNTTPQIIQILSGSSTTLTLASAVTLTAGSPWTVTDLIFTPGGSLPGYPPPTGWSVTSAFPPGAVVPVILRGFGRVNINGLTTIALGDGVGATNASVIGTRFAYATTGYASATGLIIATCLEAYAARDSYLSNTALITGHDSVRALIGKM